MKRYYYTGKFIYLGQELTISTCITDKAEDMREMCQKAEASSNMTHTLRNIGLYKNNCVDSRQVWKVKKTEAVKWADTLAQMEEARQKFEEMPTDKQLLIGLAHANGVM